MTVAANSHGWVNPKDVEELWKDHFDYFYREEEEFCFTVTTHPDVSGHPHSILMLERWERLLPNVDESLLTVNRLIEYINSKEGVEWMTMEVR
jgi:hypothetical protein